MKKIGKQQVVAKFVYNFNGNSKIHLKGKTCNVK